MMKRAWILLLVGLLLLPGLLQAAPAAQVDAANPVITTFSTSATVVDRTQLARRTARIPVSWNTANRRDDHNLVFEQILADGRVVNVELPRDNPWVASAGDGVVAPFPPGGDATSIRLRLRLLDWVRLTTLDERELTLPIGDAQPPGPTIRTFLAGVEKVAADELASRTARVPVEWLVENRPPDSNLVFEQVLANGTALNIELPRPNPIIASAGVGVVAPVPPGGNATTINLRLRLINLRNQSTITQRELSLAIDTTPPLVTVRTFTAGVARVPLADVEARIARVPVTWAVDNRPPNSNLAFEQVLADGTAVNVELPRTVPIIPSSGSGVVAPVPPGASPGNLTFRLRVFDLTSRQTLAQQEITVALDTTPPPAVAIQTFTLGADKVSAAALNDRTARIPVSWAVENRPANTNLAFEQVLADGTIVNVELPRAVPVIPSSGSGVVAPVPPGGSAQEIKLRLRVFNLATNAQLALRELTLPVDSSVPTPTIRTFTTGAASVALPDLNNRTARVPVSWTVDNRPPNSNLAFEQVLADGTAVNVELPRTVPIIPSSGNGVVAPVPPGGNAQEIKLRLRLVNLSSNQTLVQNEITLPILNAGGSASIRSFTTTATSVSQTELANRTARIPVAWVVDNRPPNSNLFFEQVMANGTIINVELPRQNPLVASVGTGVVAPITLGDNATSIRIRLRLANLANNQTLDTREFTLPIQGAPATQPTATAPAGGTAAAVEIRAFSVSPTSAERGSVVTLSWETANASRVSVALANESGGIGDIVADNLPLSGSASYSIPLNVVGDRLGFKLLAQGGDGRETVRDASVSFACASESLLPGSCPADRRLVPAAFQAFERGFMIWRGDTRRIYALYQDGSWQEFADTWTASDPDPSGEPPAGLVKPVRGFGKVWAQNSGASRLGWATGNEQAYSATWETHTVGGATAPVFTLPDGRTARLDATWVIE